jgi:hypothetical protein
MAVSDQTMKRNIAWKLHHPRHPQVHTSFLRNAAMG